MKVFNKSGKKQNSKIRKVRVLTGDAQDLASQMDVQPNDLVIVSIEKIVGEPLAYLQKRAGLTTKINETKPKEEIENGELK